MNVTFHIRRRAWPYAITGFVIAVILAISFPAYMMRVSVWDEVHSLKGRIGVDTASMYRGILSERTMFGLACCRVTSVSVDGLSNGNRLLRCLGELNLLSELSVTNSRITDEGLGILASLPSLQILSLRGNHVTDVGVRRVLSSAHGIEWLNLAYTSISSSLGKDLMCLPRLHNLCLEGTDVGNAAFARDNWKRHCVRVDLSSTQISGSTRLNLPPSLHELLISNNGNASALLQNIPELPSLTLLTAKNTVFAEDDNQQLSRMKNLRWLLISGAKFDCSLLRQIASLPQLGGLDISRCAISTTGWQMIQNFSTLSYLDISECAVPEGGWNAIQGLPNLKFLICHGTDMQQMRTDQSGWASRLHSIDIRGATVSETQIMWLKEVNSATFVYTDVKGARRGKGDAVRQHQPEDCSE